MHDPGGNICYGIPVMKTQMYTIDDIFDRKLLFLIPFYIFSHENRLKEYDRNEEKLQELQKEYMAIRKRLEELCLEGNISEYVKCTLIEMSKKVIDNIAGQYVNVRKGVAAIMGGKILEHEAKTILQRGIQEGRREGKIEGKIEGKLEGKLEGYIDLIKDGLLSVPEAARRLNMKEEELEKYL